MSRYLNDIRTRNLEHSVCSLLSKEIKRWIRKDREKMTLIESTYSQLWERRDLKGSNLIKGNDEPIYREACHAVGNSPNCWEVGAIIGRMNKYS